MLSLHTLPGLFFHPVVALDLLLLPPVHPVDNRSPDDYPVSGGCECPTSKPKAAAIEPAKLKAYSYVRFSTPERAQGDSYRRQTELTA